MPTAAKLIAAILFAVTTMIASELFKPYMPEGTQFGYFTYMNGAIAASVGWKLLGGRAGNGVTSAINNGVTALFALILFLLFSHSFRLMIIESTGIGYGSLSEALQDVAQKMVDHGLLVLNTDVLVAFGLGTVATSILAEAASRRWR